MRELFWARVEPDMADLMKAAGQDVEQESTEELNGCEGCCAGTFGPKRDGRGRKREQAAIGDADAVRVAAEILENMLAPAERGFRVDVPIDAKDRAHQAREGLGIPKVGEAYEALFAVSSAQSRDYLSAKNAAHRFDGEQE